MSQQHYDFYSYGPVQKQLIYDYVLTEPVQPVLKDVKKAPGSKPKKKKLRRKKPRRSRR